MKKTLIILILTLTTKSYGCDCLTPKTGDALRLYNVVFVGRIIEYHDSTKLYSSNPYIGQVEFYNFEIIRYYKGLTKKNKIISIIDNGSNCDIHFKHYHQGDTFLVYASVDAESLNAQILSTNICSRTKLASAIIDTEELNIYNDLGAWKYPETFEKVAIKTLPLCDAIKEGNTDSKFLTILCGILVLLNVTIIIILLKRRK